MISDVAVIDRSESGVRLTWSLRAVMTTSPHETELPTILSPVSLVKKGLCPVTEIRHDGNPLESHSLYYEQHGTGPEKIVFIMGRAQSFFVTTGRLD